MGESLQDQLRKAGLVSDKQAKKAERVKHAADMARKTQGTRDEAAVAAQRARAEKTQRDKKINAERERRAHAKAIAAQVAQLIQGNKQSREGAEIAYNFVDGRAVRKMLVTKAQQASLAEGRVAIARFGKGFELVSLEIAEKIKERDPKAIVAREETPAKAPDPDDPYAAYQIPDDLDW